MSMNYHDAKRFMNNYTFKVNNKNACNDVMKRKGLEYDQWIKHSINEKFGLKDKDGRWCWRNTINTHPYCFLELYKISQELGYDEIDFFDESNQLENIKKLWSWLESNWELIFTDNIESKYFYRLMFLTNKSWSVGQITTIAFLYTFREIFEDKEFKKIHFSLERGDLLDFVGIDIKIITKENEEITIQVKNGKFTERNSNYEISSSVNDLKSIATHYCFVNIQEDETKIIVFKNEKELIIPYFNSYTFEKELLVNKPITKNMIIPQKLHEMLIFCAENKIVFDLKNKEGEENNISWSLSPEKIVTVTIGDFKEENLGDYISTKFDELKEALK